MQLAPCFSEGWVEQGQAPDVFVAGRYSKEKGLERTFKLCAEPKRAMLKSSGLDPKEADNWECRMPKAPAT